MYFDVNIRVQLFVSFLQFFHSRSYGRRTSNYDFTGFFICSVISSFVIANVASFSNNLLALLGQDEVDKVLGDGIGLALGYNVEGTGNFVSSALNISGGSFSSINLQALNGVV